MSMEIYADPRARAGPGRRATGDGPHPGRPRPRRIPPPGCGLCKSLCTEHVPRIRALRDGDRSRPSTATPRVPGATSRSPRPSSRGAGAGRSEQMRITSHTYIHNLSGNDYPHRSIAYEQSLRRIRPRLHCQRPSHLVSESAELFHLVMIHGNCS